MTKLNISTTTLGEARKQAIERAYLPKSIKKGYRISVAPSGEVILVKKKSHPR